MKQGIWFTGLVMVLCLAFLAPAYAGTENTFDIRAYQKLTKKNIGRLISGKVDPAVMMADMEKLIAMGITGAREYMGKKETPAEEAKLMEITIANAATMSSLSMAEIEAQWHEGGFLKSKGIDVSKFGHFAKVMCYYDSLVHPATVIICLKQYQQSSDQGLLDQAKDELLEVVEHMKHLE